jgi:AraC-like DNA-binding protein
VQIERYIPPAGSELARYVLSIWRLRSEAEFSRELVLPKCNLDVLFNLGQPIGRARDGETMDALASGAVHVAGLHTRAFAAQPQGRVDVFGVSFRIETCAAFLSLPPGELADRVVDGRSLAPGMRDLAGRVGDAGDFRQQCAALHSWIGERLARHAGSDWIVAACRGLAGTVDAAPVDALAREHGLSDRTLRRRFERDLGVGPAQYLRLRRFVRAIHLMPHVSRLTDVAHAAGFHDQAHFCRDFAAIAGMSPGAYRAIAPVVPGHVFRP